MISMSQILSQGPRMNLLTEDQLPPQMREVAIISGYRPPESSLKQCILSCFVATNETLNVWTHFIPTLYFLWKTAALWSVLQVIYDPYTWPFTAFMITICTYPLISALAHTFYSMSSMSRHIWFFLDYGGLSFYGFGSGLLYIAYVFPTDFLKNSVGDIFLYVCVFNAILSTVCACFSRFLDSAFWTKIFRLGAFVIPWVWDSIPLLYRLAYSNDIEFDAAAHYTRQFVFSFLIGFLFASHLPERLAPGKFDIVGHSHQLLHICGILATHEQMSGALHDMTVRRKFLETNGHVIPVFWSVYMFFYVFLAITIIITLFSYYAKRYEKNIETKTK